MPEDLNTRVNEIVEDARRRLNVEKGHSLCTEGCDCPLAVRLVEDYLIAAQDAIERHGREDALGDGGEDTPEASKTD